MICVCMCVVIFLQFCFIPLKKYKKNSLDSSRKLKSTSFSIYFIIIAIIIITNSSSSSSISMRKIRAYIVHKSFDGWTFVRCCSFISLYGFFFYTSSSYSIAYLFAFEILNACASPWSFSINVVVLYIYWAWCVVFLAVSFRMGKNHIAGAVCYTHTIQSLNIHVFVE